MPPNRSAPYGSLLYLARHAGMTGFARPAFVSRVRRGRKSSGGFNPDSALFSALKADLRFATAGTSLAAVVASAKPQWRPRLEALAAGLTDYLRALPDRERCRPVPLHEPTVVIGGLPVKLRAQLGLRHPDGSVEAVWMWCDENPPAPESVALVLRLLTDNLEALHPAARRAVVLDVRRAEAHTVIPALPGGRVSAFVASEVAAYLASWNAAA